MLPVRLSCTSCIFVIECYKSLFFSLFKYTVCCDWKSGILVPMNFSLGSLFMLLHTHVSYELVIRLHAQARNTSILRPEIPPLSGQKYLHSQARNTSTLRPEMASTCHPSTFTLRPKISITGWKLLQSSTCTYKSQLCIIIHTNV